MVLKSASRNVTAPGCKTLFEFHLENKPGHSKTINRNLKITKHVANEIINKFTFKWTAGTNPVRTCGSGAVRGSHPTPRAARAGLQAQFFLVFIFLL